MTTDHAERLRAVLDEHIANGRLAAPRYDEADLAAVLDELEQLRGEREGWFNGAAQRLRHAYRSGWDERGEIVTACLAAVGGHTTAETRAASYVDEWWTVTGLQQLADGASDE